MSTLEIEFNGESCELVCSPKALMAVGRYPGGIVKLDSMIRAEEIDAYIFLLRVGLNLSLKESEIVAAIYESGGLGAFGTNLLVYLLMLRNGGKTLDEMASDIEAATKETSSDEGDEGNG